MNKEYFASIVIYEINQLVITMINVALPYLKLIPEIVILNMTIPGVIGPVQLPMSTQSYTSVVIFLF